MPKPKTKCRKRKQMYSIRDNSISSTLMDVDSKIIDDTNLKTKMWKVQVRDKMKDALSKLNEKKKEADESFELHFNNLLMGMKKNILNLPIDINDENFREIILSMNKSGSHENRTVVECFKTSPPPEKYSSTVRRRSKSVNITKQSIRSSRLRSTSVDVYKTPTGRIRLSSIMSHKKYTVMKPARSVNSGLNVKRIMKPDEIAISTCGSPLYVASSSLGAPHVNIPLPGGVILNIEPKEPEGPLEVPGLDVKTKHQLKILCEQLKKLF